MKFRLVKATQCGDDILLWARGEDGEKVCFPVLRRPYFFVDELEAVDDAAIIGNEWNYQAQDSTRLRMIAVWNKMEADRIKGQLRQYWEDSIPSARRLLIDWKLCSGFDEQLDPCSVPGTPLSIWYFGFRIPEDSQKLCYTVYVPDSNDTISVVLDDVDFRYDEDDNYIVRFDNEWKVLELLSRMLYAFSPDCLVGWRVTEAMNYLVERAEQLGVYLPLDATCVFDLFPDTYLLPNAESTDPLECSACDAKNAAALDRRSRIVEWFWQLKELACLEDLECARQDSILAISKVSNA